MKKYILSQKLHAFIYAFCTIGKFLRFFGAFVLMGFYECWRDLKNFWRAIFFKKAPIRWCIHSAGPLSQAKPDSSPFRGAKTRYAFPREIPDWGSAEVVALRATLSSAPSGHLPSKEGLIGARFARFFMRLRRVLSSISHFPFPIPHFPFPIFHFSIPNSRWFGDSETSSEWRWVDLNYIF